jgi:hypothetical protein
MAMHHKQWLELATDAKAKAYNVLFARKVHVADLVLTVPPKATTLTAEYFSYDKVRIVDQDGNTVAKLEKYYSKHFPLELK